MKKALFVGRFQPFHKGHMDVLSRLCRRYGKVYIIIGSATESGTYENPFTVEERIEMARRALEGQGIGNFEISSVEDFHDDRLWTSAIKRAFQFDVAYSRNPWTIECFRRNGVQARKHSFVHERKYSGKEIRKRMAKGRSWEGLVPPEVREYIVSIGGDERVRKISKKEKHAA
jgi:nicotinamide-nucleotide adenylyltransferase